MMMKMMVKIRMMMRMTKMYTSGDDGGRGENGVGLVEGGRGGEDGTNTIC